MNDLLHADDINFRYGDSPVLRHVNIGLRAGEVVMLLGPNGSGKSTLIKVLLGNLHSACAIAWNSRRLSDWRRRDLARFVAYLPQSPAWDLDHRVVDVLRLGRAPYLGPFGIESATDYRVVQDIAVQLGLVGLLDRRMDELSGGQRQRVFVGRCLVQEPRAMLLDEPGTFLDLRHQVELCQLLRRLARETRIGVLMASHDLNLTGLFADRVVLLNEGAVEAEGAPAEVLNPELLSRVYGVPMRRIENDGAPVVLPDVGTYNQGV